MLPNFENYTQNLQLKQKEVVPYLQKILENKTAETNMLLSQVAIKKISDVILRKLIHYMRTHDIMPICSSSQGYFVSYDEKILVSQIISLSKRGNCILSCAYGLERFIK